MWWRMLPVNAPLPAGRTLLLSLLAFLKGIQRLSVMLSWLTRRRGWTRRAPRRCWELNWHKIQFGALTVFLYMHNLKGWTRLEPVGVGNVQTKELLFAGRLRQQGLRDPNTFTRTPSTKLAMTCLALQLHRWLRPRRQKVPTIFVAVRCASWNVAGTNSTTIKLIFDALVQCDVVAVQEYPKQDVGWKSVEGDVFRGLVHQNHLMYRGVGIFYNASKFQLLGRRGTHRGMWVQLKHVRSGEVLWVGSIHLPNSETRDEILRMTKDVLAALPKTACRAVLLGDFNIQFSWQDTREGVLPGGMTAKWAGVRQLAADAGFQQIPPGPPQVATPTFHSRKGNVACAQIDGALLRGDTKHELRIREGSRHEVGTDHDRIEVVVGLQAAQAGKRSGCWWCACPYLCPPSSATYHPSKP